MTLTLDVSRTTMAGGIAGTRVQFELEPSVGPDGKPAPATYGDKNSATTKPAEENRRIGEKDVLSGLAGRGVAPEGAMRSKLTSTSQATRSPW